MLLRNPGLERTKRIIRDDTSKWQEIEFFCKKIMNSVSAACSTRKQRNGEYHNVTRTGRRFLKTKFCPPDSLHGELLGVRVRT